MPANNDQDLKERLREHAQLSNQQVEAVLTWLANHEDKKISFSLMFHKDIEMMLDSGIINKKENFDVQSWAWKQIESWMQRQEQETS